MTLDACESMAAVADVLAAEHPEPRDLLVALGHRVAGVPRGPLAVLGLLAGGRTRLRGVGFRTDLHDSTTGQTRHFAGVARAVTVLGPGRTEWLSVHVRRDRPESPDGRLTSLAVEFASRLLDGTLAPEDAGEWIRANVCA